MKICKRCLKEKSISEFYKNHMSKDGLNYWCKSCVYIKSKKWIKKNNKHVSSLQKQWWKNNLLNFPWYNSYRSARNRCVLKKQKAYKYYGERGIKFLMKKNDFEFLWDRDSAILMKKPSIDRIDSSKNYELSNCRFIEQSENAKRRN